MNDETLGEYKRTTPDPDETTGEALARLQATMTRLLDEADAELAGKGADRDAAELREKLADAERERDEATAAMEQLACERDTARADRDTAEHERDQAVAAHDEARTLTARQHLDAAWHAAHIPADGMIPAGAAYITRNSAGGMRGPFTEDEPLPHTDPIRVVQRRLLDPPRPEGAEDIDEHLRQANAAALGGALTPEQRRALADHLAGFGYRSPIGLAEEDPR